MKITKKILEKLIKEEIQKILTENETITENELEKAQIDAMSRGPTKALNIALQERIRIRGRIDKIEVMLSALTRGKFRPDTSNASTDYRGKRRMH